MKTPKYSAEEMHRILDGVDDFATQVLKMHLLIESRFDDILALVCRKPAALDSRRFGFWAKCRILEAICGDQDPDLWTPLDKFNAIRNEISHSLDVVRKVKLVDELATALGVVTTAPEWSKDTDAFRSSFCEMAFVMLLIRLDEIEEAVNQRFHGMRSHTSVGGQ